MEIHIHIDGRLFHRINNRAIRRAAIAAVFVVPCVALAATSVPNVFQPGSTLSAADMNANFTALATTISNLDERLARIEATKPLPSADSVFAYAGTAAPDGTLARQYNSTGGLVGLAGSSGSYTVTFNGIDCGVGPGTGIAIAQASGASAISCRVNGDWHNVGAGCRIFVTCFNTSGNAISAPFSLIYAR